jgi:flagellar biosynthesis/type III secretory pathway protein FliH
MTLAEQLFKEGYDKGFAIGFEKGLERSRRAGVLIPHARWLQRLLGQAMSRPRALMRMTLQELESMVAALEREITEGFKRD